MQIGKIPLPPSQILFHSPKEFVKAWEVGQLLRGNVVSDPASQQRFVDIAGVRIKVAQNFPFANGQPLTLRVEQTAEQPALRIITPPLTAHQSPLSEALRAVIHNQAPLARLLPGLIQLFNATGKAAATPAPVIDSDIDGEAHKAIEQLRANLPKLNELFEAKPLRQRALESGTFFEQQLSSLLRQPATPALQRDLKFIILFLVSRLRSTITDASVAVADAGKKQALAPAAEKGRQQPATADTTLPRLDTARFEQLEKLLKISESILSRIQLNQLSSVAQSNEATQVWHIEIPYTHANRQEALQLRIAHDRNSSHEQGEASWTVDFSFELDRYGQVMTHVTLQARSVSLRFVSETAQAQTLLANNLPLLESRLRALGFNVTALHAGQGEPGDIMPLQSGEALLDTHA